MRGRKPKPAALKFGEAGLLSAGPQASEAPDPPDWLTDGALDEWHRLVPCLARLGLTHEIDQQALAQLAFYSSEISRLLPVIGKEPSKLLNNGVVAPHPDMKYLKHCQDHFNKHMAAFGISPTARARLALAPEQGETESKLDKLLARRNRVETQTIDRGTISDTGSEV